MSCGIIIAMVPPFRLWPTLPLGFTTRPQKLQPSRTALLPTLRPSPTVLLLTRQPSRTVDRLANLGPCRQWSLLLPPHPRLELTLLFSGFFLGNKSTKTFIRKLKVFLGRIYNSINSIYRIGFTPGYFIGCGPARRVLRVQPHGSGLLRVRVGLQAHLRLREAVQVSLPGRQAQVPFPRQVPQPPVHWAPGEPWPHPGPTDGAVLTHQGKTSL